MKEPTRRRRSASTRARIRRRDARADALLRALERVYAHTREDPVLAAVRQRLGR